MAATKQSQSEEGAAQGSGISALREKVEKYAYYAAFWKATNSVRVATLNEIERGITFLKPL